MNTLIKKVAICTVLVLLISGCDIQAAQSKWQPRQPTLKEAVYEDMLGKPITNRFVADFLTKNHCSRANQVRLCREAGIALWIDSSHIVQTVYLYLNNSDAIAPYQGELPFGLKFYDTMGAVQYKLDLQGIGKKGQPDSGEAPDHMHYRAVYKQARMTIIYNSPWFDEDATIHAVLVYNREVAAWQP